MVLVLMQLNKKFIGLFLLIWILMIGTFLFTSIGTESYRLLLQIRRFFPGALAFTLAFYLWKKNDFSIKQLIPEILIFIFWLFTYNCTSFVTNKDFTTNLNNYADITFASYIFAFLVSVKILSAIGKRVQKASNILITLAEAALMMIPLVSLMYFCNYGSIITSSSAIALLQTNPNEAKEYLLQNIGNVGIAGISFFLLFMLGGFYKINSSAGKTTKSCSLKKHLILLGAILIAVGAYLPKSFVGTGVMQSLIAAENYLSSAKQFQVYHENNLKNLQVELPKATFSKPSTIIVLLGESYGRNFMSAYGYSENDTTPWLKKVTANDEKHFIKYNHAYSSFGSTMQSLERALTEKSQYNEIEFSKSFSIIDLARKAGYKTYWFSNQGIMNSTETPIQLVAKTADVSYWIEQEQVTLNRVMYDGDLIKCLEKVNPNENNFIVIHVMGCHELTLHRFPEGRTKFGKPGVFDLIRNYEDAMAYNDWVIEKIFEYGKDKLNLQAMLLFSDHGANPYRKRTAENIPFINVRIPLIVYLSEEYQALYPETAKGLRDNKDKYFFNDLIYEAVGGLLNLKSDHLNQKNSIASFEYQFTKDMVKTDLGKKFVKDDIHEDQIEY